jgi:hypothetical protein
MSILSEIRTAPLRQRAKIVLDSICGAEPTADSAALEGAASESFWRRSSRFAGAVEFMRQTGPYTPICAREVSDHCVEARLHDTKGRDWLLNLRIETAAPFGIEATWLYPPLPDGFEVREATAADGPALARLEAEIPIVTKDGSTAIDRGARWWDTVLLRGEYARILVAEREGEIIAFMSNALHDAEFEGEHFILGSGSHARVSERARGHNLFPTLLAHSSAWQQPMMDSSIGIVDPSNDAMVHVLRERGKKFWSHRLVRVVLDCNEIAKQQGACAASGPDIEEVPSRMAELLNRAHAGTIFYRHADVESVSSRLSLLAEGYGPRDIAMTPNALVGVWQSGHRYTKTSHEGTRCTVRATIMDHACIPSAEGEFEALLRACAARCGKEKIDELTLLVDADSASADVARRLPHHVEAYLLTLDLDEPENAAASGLFVDPMWF